jgi:hypothetical protein
MSDTKILCSGHARKFGAHRAARGFRRRMIIDESNPI